MPWFAQLTDRPTLSYWTVAEFSSAAAMQERIGRIATDRRLLAEQHFDAWLTTIEHWPVLRTDFELARDFIRRGRAKLRTPDALHLAIARRLDAEIATLDGGLADAARDVGVLVAAI